MNSPMPHSGNESSSGGRDGGRVEAWGLVDEFDGDVFRVPAHLDLQRSWIARVVVSVLYGVVEGLSEGRYELVVHGLVGVGFGALRSCEPARARNGAHGDVPEGKGAWHAE